MISTRLTERLSISHPILSAPMAFAAGGELASAVTRAGALGLIGGAYGDPDWVSSQFEASGNIPVGCGFITWNLTNALANSPELLSSILARKPKVMMLSFGNPQPFAEQIISADVMLACQVQSLKDAKKALDCGSEMIIAQGSEAGGHGESRGTMTLVPEIADHLSKINSDALLCAAGGIADGRGLAAALMLGADGALVGSRLWASSEAAVHPNMHKAAIDATGDDTIRSSVMDIARKLEWPERYTARVLKNAFTEKWHNDIDGLINNAAEESARWREAWVAGQMDTANTFVGEVTGLIDEVLPAEQIIQSMVQEAKERLKLFS